MPPPPCGTGPTARCTSAMNWPPVASRRPRSRSTKYSRKPGLNGLCLRRLTTNFCLVFSILVLARFVSHHTSEEEDEAMIAAARALRAPLAPGFAFARPEFLSPRNLSNIALQSAALIIVSLGMTLVILTEGIDLSLGAVLGLAGVVMSMLLVSHGSLFTAIGAAVLIGLVAGCCNGTLVAYAGMPPFIVTLGVYGIAQSLAMVLTEGNSD